MSYDRLPIVGAFYRPPAKLVLESLPIGATLFLCAEPDNAYDPNAVAVWIETAAVPPSAHSKLETELPNCGLTLDEFLSQEQWHLGYIPKEFAALLRSTKTIEDDAALTGSFTLGDRSKPYFKFDSPVL